MKKNTQSVFVAILCILQVVSLLKISQLQSRLSQVQQEVSSSTSMLSSQVSNLSATVSDQLERQASILDQASYTLGTADAKTLTVPVTVTLTPKTTTVSSVVTLVAGGQTAVMERSGTTFSATISVGIFEPFAPRVILEDGNTQQTQQLEELSLEPLKDKVLPVLFAYFDGQASYQAGQYHVAGQVSVESKPSGLNIGWAETRLKIAVDDAVVYEETIPLSAEENPAVDIDRQIPLASGQACTITVIATDTLGLSHHCIVHYWQQTDDNISPEPSMFGEETIYSANGTLLSQR